MPFRIIEMLSLNKILNYQGEDLSSGFPGGDPNIFGLPTNHQVLTQIVFEYQRAVDPGAKTLRKGVKDKSIRSV